MWGLSSPARDQTRVSCIRRQVLDHGTTREAPSLSFLKQRSHPVVLLISRVDRVVSGQGVLGQKPRHLRMFFQKAGEM